MAGISPHLPQSSPWYTFPPRPNMSDSPVAGSGLRFASTPIEKSFWRTLDAEFQAIFSEHTDFLPRAKAVQHLIIACVIDYAALGKCGVAFGARVARIGEQALQAMVTTAQHDFGQREPLLTSFTRYEQDGNQPSEEDAMQERRKAIQALLNTAFTLQTPPKDRIAAAGTALQLTARAPPEATLPRETEPRRVEAALDDEDQLWAAEMMEYCTQALMALAKVLSACHGHCEVRLWNQLVPNTGDPFNTHP